MKDLSKHDINPKVTKYDKLDHAKILNFSMGIKKERERKKDQNKLK